MSNNRTQLIHRWKRLLYDAFSIIHDLLIYLFPFLSVSKEYIKILHYIFGGHSLGLLNPEGNFSLEFWMKKPAALLVSKILRQFRSRHDDSRIVFKASRATPDRLKNSCLYAFIQQNSGSHARHEEAFLQICRLRMALDK